MAEVLRGRPREHGARERVQLRSSASLINAATKAAKAFKCDRNAWIVWKLTDLAQDGLPNEMRTEAALSAIGGVRADLTIDIPIDVSNQIKKRAEAWKIPRSTWINLALSSVIGG